MTLLRRATPFAFGFAVLVGLAGPAAAQTNDPSFRLNNRGAVTINEVYVSSANDNGWGNDRLGQNVLQPGQTMTIRLPSGQCMNDIKVVYANGRSQEWRRRDTCQITDFNVQ